VRDLGDLSPVALFAVLAQRWAPCILGQREDRAAHLLGQIEPDEVADLGVAGRLAERERRAGRVGSQHDLGVQSATMSRGSCSSACSSAAI
jgi:hypothetical protein